MTPHKELGLGTTEGNFADCDGGIFAFDLRFEVDNFKKRGDGYKSEFIKNAETLIEEVYGRCVVGRPFFHSINRDPEKGITLFIDALGKTAIESYQEPLYDVAKPYWYRSRIAHDVVAIESLQLQIDQDPLGVFVDPSPTAFDVDYQDRSAWYFGNHSFLRLHQLKKIDDKEVLVGVPIRHYLDPAQQELLIERLTNQQVPISNQLSFIGKIPDLQVFDILNSKDIRGIVDLINEIYENGEDNLQPLNDEVALTEEEMDWVIRSGREWLDDITKKLISISKIERDEDRMSRLLVLLGEFRGWEMQMKDLTKEVLLRRNGITRQEILENNPKWAMVYVSNDTKLKKRTYYQEMARNYYSTRLSQCGNKGSGISGALGVVQEYDLLPSSRLTDHLALSVEFNPNNDKQFMPCVKCPFCLKIVDAEITNDNKLKCPKCNRQSD